MPQDIAPVNGEFKQLQNKAQLDGAIDHLLSVADNERALRNFEGMVATGDNNTWGVDNPRHPLGADSSYYIGSVWIAPAYRDITTTVTGGSAQIILTGAVDAFKAVAGETVEFAVVSSDTVKVTVGGEVLTADAQGVYSFVMPEGDAAIVVAVSDGTTPDEPEYGEPGSGDLDGDGFVSAAEAMTLANYIVGNTELTVGQKAAADIDGDGKLTMADVVKLLRKAAGL